MRGQRRWPGAGPRPRDHRTSVSPAAPARWLSRNTRTSSSSRNAATARRAWEGKRRMHRAWDGGGRHDAGQSGGGGGGGDRHTNRSADAGGGGSAACRRPRPLSACPSPQGKHHRLAPPTSRTNQTPTACSAPFPLAQHHSTAQPSRTALRPPISCTKRMPLVCSASATSLRASGN